MTQLVADSGVAGMELSLIHVAYFQGHIFKSCKKSFSELRDRSVAMNYIESELLTAEMTVGQRVMGHVGQQ